MGKENADSVSAGKRRRYKNGTPTKRNPKDILKCATIKYAFRITGKEYNAIVGKQLGVCAICHKPETKTIKGKKVSLSIDHCHRTGKVRGLLCHNCNIVLGHAMESTDILMKAIEYIKEHE